MKKRIIWKMFLLEIVTLGIYRLYWFIKTRKEMMALNPTIKIKSPMYLLLPFILIPILLIMLIIASFANTSTISSNSNCNGNYSNSYNDYSGSNTSNTNSTSNRECNDVNTQSSAMELIIPLALYSGVMVSFFLYIIWIWSYAKGVDVITDGKISFALGLVVLILVPDGIDILIIQEYYNKIAEKSQRPPQKQQTVQS